MRGSLRTPVIFGCALGGLALAFIYRKNFIDTTSLGEALNRGEDIEGRELLRSTIQEERKKLFKKS